MNKFYLTTAIDYPNAKPHVGTAFEKIGADVMNRYRRWRGDDVFFLMGNDENTWKVAKRAHELNENPKGYCDRMTQEFKLAWSKLHIFPNRFIQTTEDDHVVGVKLFLETAYKSGLFYKKKYQGLYCDGCEAFKTAKEGDVCPDHPKQSLRAVEEENWFFKLSSCQQTLLVLYQANAIAIEPETRRNEVVNFVEAGLDDISISRRNEGWGIPLPWDESQVVYVWFDALLNYLTGIGFGKDLETFKKYWPADVHFIGKDITRFHCALFPAMIMAYNAGLDAHVPTEELDEQPNLISLPKRVYAHGFIYKKTGGVSIKESKTNGVAVDPMDLVKLFGADAYRYYFLSKCDYGNDGEYSIDHMIEVYNADLANNLGNLVSRVVGMTQRYFDGKLEDMAIMTTSGTLLPFHERYVEAMDHLKYRDALVAVWDILRLGNAWIDEQKPWELIKTDRLACSFLLKQLTLMLRAVSLYLKPFMPLCAEKVYNSFTGGVPWNETHWDYLLQIVSQGSEGLFVNVGVNQDSLIDGKYPPLFQRIDPKEEPLFKQFDPQAE